MTTFDLGLTGSIGMGKSTTAKLFRDAGCAVWDADAAVRRLYSPGGLAVAPLEAAFPGTMRDGAVDRARLKAVIAADAGSLKRIEAIVHPLVAADREDFRATAKADVRVFDIPLLFETGGESRMDAVACVSVDPETQARRVLARGTMTREEFEHLRAKQMPDAEKRARADYVIITDTLEHARRQVQDVLADIRKRLANA